MDIATCRIVLVQILSFRTVLNIAGNFPDCRCISLNDAGQKKKHFPTHGISFMLLLSREKQNYAFASVFSVHSWVDVMGGRSVMTENPVFVSGSILNLIFQK